MTKSIFTLAVGLLLATLYYFQADLMKGHFSQIIKFQKVRQTDSINSSSIGNNLTKINWSNPVSLKTNRSKNNQFETSLDLNKSKKILQSSSNQLNKETNQSLKLENQVVKMTADIQPIKQIKPIKLVKNIKPTKPAHLKKQATLIKPIKQTNKAIPAEKVILKKNITLETTQSRLKKTKNSSAIKQVKPVKKEEDNKQKETFKNNLVAAPKNKNNNNNNKKNFNDRLNKIELSIQTLLSSYKNLDKSIKEIAKNQVKKSLSFNQPKKNQQLVKKVKKVKNRNKVEKTSTIKQIPTQTNQPEATQSEQIQAIIQTIINTRALLESLPKKIDSNSVSKNVPDNKLIAKQAKQSVAQIIKKTKVKAKVRAKVNNEKKSEQVPLKELNNQLTEKKKQKKKQKENLNLLTQKQQKELDQKRIKEFALGMVDYAINLSKGGKDLKALKIMLQVEPKLSHNLHYLRAMVELQKKLGDTNNIIIYLRKAAVQSVFAGDYASFQEIIGETMQIDMLVAGDLIKKYSSRFRLK